MREIIKSIFKWIFREELSSLQNKLDQYEQKTKELKALLGNTDISIDVDPYSSSWAVISIQGGSTDFIRFIDLGSREMRDIQSFLRQFEKHNIKIDAPHGMKDRVLGIRRRM